MNVLFVASEVHPLIKTGGLADVCGSLPVALERLGHDVRVVLPGFPQVFDEVGPLAHVAEFNVLGTSEPVRLLEGRLGETGVVVYVVDSPAHFDRPGSPYVAPGGQDWPDNAIRFAVFARAAVALAMGRLGLDFAPALVHCHDWHTGLVPTLLAQHTVRPATLFTIHNLAYQGLFSYEEFRALKLPADMWCRESLEFYDRMSFLKGGLMHSDWLTTVSPTYAREIRTQELGCGLDGVLRHRRDRVVGILNGADYAIWDPSGDAHLPQRYTASDPGGKVACKRALQARLGLALRPDMPLVAFVGRLVEQKGVDLVLDSIPQLMERGVQVVVMGSGERRFGDAMRAVAKEGTWERRLATHVGYTEELAHNVLAGADMLLMPSRFEPCGLTQIYGLRYGAVPIVRRTGGLADTISNVTRRGLQDGTANGFSFEPFSAQAMLASLDRALELYAQPTLWNRLRHAGMTQDFSWARSAERYVDLYRGAMSIRAAQSTGRPRRAPAAPVPEPTPRLALAKILSAPLPRQAQRSTLVSAR